MERSKDCIPRQVCDILGVHRLHDHLCGCVEGDWRGLYCATFDEHLRQKDELHSHNANFFHWRSREREEAAVDFAILKLFMTAAAFVSHQAVKTLEYLDLQNWRFVALEGEVQEMILVCDSE